MEREPGVVPYTFWSVEQGRVEPTDGGVIEESLVSIFVNTEELATVMCSPLDQEALALGFLFNEGVIDSLDEVRLVRANVRRTGVDVFLNRDDFSPPRRMILTSGCGGGITFQHLAETHPPLESDFIATPELVLARMRDLQGAAYLYNTVRGVHTAVLANEHGLLVSAEDVGRHNAVDKIAGKALLGGIATRDRIVLTSGRISSEMLNKTRRMGVPLVASRTAPTSIAVQLAQTWNICVVGYVRRDGLRVYTHGWRLGLSEPAPQATMSHEAPQA